MKLAIMQPYWFPYIGYWQLLSLADVFVIYDNIQYTKKGWVSRNRYLSNGKDEVFSIALTAGASDLDVRDREISPSFDRQRVLRRLEGAYRRAPFFSAAFDLIQRLVNNPASNLFVYVNQSVGGICEYLGIETPRLVSSSVEPLTTARGQDRVIALCQSLGAAEYINPIGGVELYNGKDFERYGVKLRFLRSRLVPYSQFGHPFVPWLSIIDVLMFNSLDQIRQMLGAYDIEGE